MSENKKKVCPKCGATNPIDAQFCFGCGGKLNEDVPVNDQDANQAKDQQNKQQTLPNPICPTCGAVSPNSKRTSCFRCGTALDSEKADHTKYYQLLDKMANDIHVMKIILLIFLITAVVGGVCLMIMSFSTCICNSASLFS